MAIRHKTTVVNFLYLPLPHFPQKRQQVKRPDPASAVASVTVCIQLSDLLIIFLFQAIFVEKSISAAQSRASVDNWYAAKPPLVCLAVADRTDALPQQLAS